MNECTVHTHKHIEHILHILLNHRTSSHFQPIVFHECQFTFLVSLSSKHHHIYLSIYLGGCCLLVYHFSASSRSCDLISRSPSFYIHFTVDYINMRDEKQRTFLFTVLNLFRRIITFVVLLWSVDWRFAYGAM